MLLIGLLASPSWANPPKLSALIGQVAQQEGVDPNLLKAIVAIESKFDTVSVSTRGAVGLMQLMPDTARALGVRDRFNPEQNLRGGARYLRQMMERFPESISLALAAYNAGPATVSRFGGIPPFPETKRYIKDVLSYFAKTVPGSNRSPKSIRHHRKNQFEERSVAATAHQRIVRLLGSDDEEGDEDAPRLHSPRPMPAPKAVHTVKRGYARTDATTIHAVTDAEPTHSSRLIPYVSSRHTGARYQARNVTAGSEEIPVVVLRR